MQLDHNIENLLDWPQFLAALRLSPTTAERAIRNPDSDIPRPFKIGRRRFVFRDDVVAYLKAKQATTRH